MVHDMKGNRHVTYILERNYPATAMVCGSKELAFGARERYTSTAGMCLGRSSKLFLDICGRYWGGWRDSNGIIPCRMCKLQSRRKSHSRDSRDFCLIGTKR